MNVNNFPSRCLKRRRAPIKPQCLIEMTWLDFLQGVVRELICAQDGSTEKTRPGHTVTQHPSENIPSCLGYRGISNRSIFFSVELSTSDLVKDRTCTVSKELSRSCISSRRQAGFFSAPKIASQPLSVMDLHPLGFNDLRQY